MTISDFPESGSFVELTAADDPVAGVRVVHSSPGSLTLSMAAADLPAPGSAVTVRWPAGARGRFVLVLNVLSVGENKAELEPIGEAGLEQHRHFVRGGGGEPILLRQPGQDDAYGWIRDISEQSVRAHFGGLDVQDGEQLTLLVELGADIVELKAVAAKVARLRQQVPPGPMSVELVAIFTAGEAQAKIIRRYVMHQQMLSRTRA
jgi:hypothetical protein